MNNPTDWLTLARDAYTASTAYFDSSIRQQIEADLRQSQGQHPTGSKYLSDRGRSRLFRPKTRATIRKNEAQAAEAFFSTTDVVAISPENDNDPLQKASAAVMSELLQYRLTKSIPWFLTLVGAYQDAQTVGVVASYQYWEYNEKKKLDRPAIRLIPIENLRFDPGANWTDPVGTSPYIVELIPMYLGQVRQRMTNPDPKTGEAKWHSLPDSVILTATKSYGDTIRMTREGQRMDSKYQTQANNAYNVVWVHKNIVSVDDVDYVYYTLGVDHLLSDPRPLDEVYFHGRRPYVIGSCIVETHKNYPSGVPRLTRDVQAEINEVANSRIDNVKLAMNKRYFARRNKQVDIRSVTRNVPGSVTLMQDIDDVKVVEYNDVTGSSYKEQEVLNLDFDDMAGAFSGASVQSNRKLNETVGGMNLLSTSANQVSGYQLRTFVETWVEPVLRQIVLLEQYYETDENILGLCGQAAQMQKFGVDQITDDMLMQEFTLNVNVGMGATNPQEQVQQFISGMSALRDMLADGSLQRLGLKVEEVIAELFGKLGYKDGSRFFELEQQDPQIAQLQATIQQLQDALNAKHPPELLAAMVRKVDAEIASMGVKDKVSAAEAVKKGSEAQFSAMQTAEVIAAVPAVAPIADELMKAAGYVVPTPAGVDPNFPQPQAPANQLALGEIKNRRTGVGFMPGDATLPTPSTTLRPAAPLDSNTGQRQGIETVRPDSIAQAAFADGGLLGPVNPLTGLTDDAETSVYQTQQARQPSQGAQSSQSAPRDTEADTRQKMIRALKETGGQFINADGELDNLHRYNLAAVGLAPDPLRTSPLHDALNSGFFNSGQMAATSVLRQSINEAASNHFANGGVINGPGTGTSDSIAATAGSQPIAVSNGEYHIPAAVVDALGQDFFERLVEEFHTPSGTSDPAMPVSDQPLPLEPGAFIVPADVVEALGRDFFDKLVEQYGGAQ
jgi:hypothetical protein